MSLLILSEDGLGCPYLYDFMSLYRVSILDIVFLEMVLMFLFPCLFRDCVLVMGIFDCETIDVAAWSETVFWSWAALYLIVCSFIWLTWRPATEGKCLESLYQSCCRVFMDAESLGI
jgi:hypothetical protein